MFVRRLGVVVSCRAWFMVTALALMVLVGADPEGAAAKTPIGPAVVGRSDIPTIPAQVRVVQTADPRCGMQCEQWITIEGPIGTGSFARFAGVLRHMGRRQPTVLINSPGGSVNDAMAIGRLIRAKQLDVAVSRVALVSCPADRVACRHMTPDGILLGEPLPPHAACASSCPLVLAGGVRRFVVPGASVGVHEYESFQTRTKVMNWFRTLFRDENGKRVVINRTLVSQKVMSRTTVMTPPDYTATKAYLAEMGIDPDLLRLFKLAPHDRIFWLDQTSLRSTRLETSSDDVADDYFYGIDARPAPLAGRLDRAAASPAASSTPQTPAMGDQLEHAVFEKQYGQHESFRGSVRWTVEKATPNLVDGPVLVADVTLPDDFGSLTMRMDRVIGSSNPQVLRVVLLLHLSSKCPLPLVQTIEPPAVHQPAAATPLRLIGLNTASTFERRELLMPEPMNRELIDAAEWFDVMLELEHNNRADIGFARGVSGGKAFDDWVALDRAHSQAMSRLQGTKSGS